MAVLTPQGLVISRYPEIVQTIQNALKQNVAANLDFDEDTLISQLVNIFANEFAKIEEIIQVLNDARDKDKAEGTVLDDLFALIGVRRQASTKSSGFVEFTTRDGVTINRNVILRNPFNGIRYRTAGSILSSKDAARQVWLTPEVIDSHTYSININGNTFTYTSSVGETVLGICTGLALAITNFNSSKFNGSVEVLSGNTMLKVSSKDDDLISLTFIQDFNVDYVEVSVPTEAEEFGPIITPPSSVTELVTGVANVISVNNNREFGVGRLRETDQQLRNRVTSTLTTVQGSTYAAMYNAILNLSGVSNALLIENDSDLVVDSLPPHSFEVVVEAPDNDGMNQSIARTIWQNKPIGIPSYGDTSVNIIDEISTVRTIKFSRPSAVFIAMRVTYWLYSEELPVTDIEEVIRSAVVSYSQALTTGKDVFPTRFIGPIYNATGSGLGQVIVEGQILPSETTAPDPGEWTEGGLSINSRQFASINPLNIFIVEGT